MKFRPLHDRVVVRRITPLEKSAGGIIIPDTVKEKPMEGEIVAAGAGRTQRAGRHRRAGGQGRATACCSANGPARK